MTTPLADPILEATRVHGGAQVAGLTLRVTGGVAVAIRCPSSQLSPLARPYGDIDLVAPLKESRRLVELFAALGYQPDAAFNALHGARRLFFWDPVNSRQIDVFLDVFEMCHKLDLTARLRLPGTTISLADLLLSKLQVVETNDKDLKDILSLLVDHPLSDDETGTNVSYIATLTASDWGLWRTTTMIAERAEQYSQSLEGFTQRDRVHTQVARLLGALERSAKSTRWKLRARLGDRVRWYELPEEGH
jgi:hypothetical protein